MDNLPVGGLGKQRVKQRAASRWLIRAGIVWVGGPYRVRCAGPVNIDIGGFLASTVQETAADERDEDLPDHKAFAAAGWRSERPRFALELLSRAIREKPLLW